MDVIKFKTAFSRLRVAPTSVFIYFHNMSYMRRSEDKPQEPVLSAHHVGLGDETQVIGFGFKH